MSNKLRLESPQVSKFLTLSQVPPRRVHWCSPSGGRQTAVSFGYSGIRLAL